MVLLTCAREENGKRLSREGEKASTAAKIQVLLRVTKQNDEKMRVAMMAITKRRIRATSTKTATRTRIGIAAT
jgi:ribosomal protein S3AE